MRKLTYLFLFIFLGALVGCNQSSSEELESLENGVINAKPGSDAKLVENYTGKIGECGETVYEFKAGSNSMDAGDVMVSYDENYLYVKVISTAGFQNVSENVKMWVGTNLNDLPTSNGTGAPINGQFPYKATVSGDTHVFQIALADIGGGLNCDEQFYIVVHGDVLVEYNGQTSAQTAYAGDKEGEGNRWWWNMEETVECCIKKDIGWLYKTSSPELYVKCFTDNDINGFTNEIHYAWVSTAQPSYPIWKNVKENCGIDEIIPIGRVYFKIINQNTNPSIEMVFKMNEGYEIDNLKVYVGWDNPLDAQGVLKPNIIFDIIKELNQSSYGYSKLISLMQGSRPAGRNPPFFVIASVD